MIFLFFFFVFFVQFSAGFVLNSPPEFQPGYGYVGPACAVFDGTLFLHGVSKRKLNDHELHIFSAYQHDLSTFKDASYDSFEASFPTIPKFCGGYDDSIEVVLDSCIVRNNHVYVGDQLVRPLTNFEKQKIQLVKMRRMYGESKKRKRVKRSVGGKNEPGTRPQRDFSEMLHKLLNINSTVTSRFLPVVSQSPLFAMEGPFQNLLELGKDKDVLNLLSSSSSQLKNNENEKTVPIVDITKIDSPYRPSFVFSTPKPRKFAKNVQKTEKSTRISPSTTTTTSTTTTSTTTSTTTERPRQISLQTLPPTTTGRPPKIETVIDPIILKLITKALENNEMIDEVALKHALSMNRVHTTTPALPLRFIIPSPSPSAARVAGVSHNHLFIPHQPFTSLASSDSRFSAPNPLSHRLPNEICRVHVASNPFFIY